MLIWPITVFMALDRDAQSTTDVIENNWHSVNASKKTLCTQPQILNLFIATPKLISVYYYISSLLTQGQSLQ